MLKKRLNFRELLKDTEEAKSGLNCYPCRVVPPRFSASALMRLLGDFYNFMAVPIALGVKTPLMHWVNTRQTGKHLGTSRISHREFFLREMSRSPDEPACSVHFQPLGMHGQKISSRLSPLFW